MGKHIILKVVQDSLAYYRLILSSGQELLVHKETLLRFRLLAGKELDEQLLNEIQVEDQLQSGYAKALNYLSYRPRSVYEVKQYLAMKEVSKEAIEQIINRLAEKGYLDDYSFARKWVNDRNRLKPRGINFLKAELRQKGIDDSTIEEVLSEIDKEEEIEKAMQIGRKKMIRLKSQPWHDVRPKIGRYLSQKGFTMDVILEILPILEEEFAELA
jgi:regulatory protein